MFSRHVTPCNVNVRHNRIVSPHHPKVVNNEHRVVVNTASGSYVTDMSEKYGLWSRTTGENGNNAYITRVYTRR